VTEARSARQVLVLIDLQQGLVQGPPAVAHADQLLATVGALLARARAARVPVIFVEDEDVGPAGTVAGSTCAAVAPQAGERVLRKTACDAFHATDLLAHCHALGATELVIAGCKTEACIDTTCRRATTLGLQVKLLADAHSTTDSPVLTAAQIIAHHQHVLDGFGCELEGEIYEIAVIPSAEVAW
jgi:nicotinamidase-related amidase